MAKSKKKRTRELAAAQSPNGVESDVSLAATSQPPSAPAKSSTPTTSTPTQTGAINNNNSNDDPSTWSKSKRKRMRQKRKKEGIAQKKDRTVDDGKQNATNASKPSTPNGKVDPEGNSKKRQRKNPDSDSNDKSSQVKQAVANTSTPKKKVKSNTTISEKNGADAQKSPPKTVRNTVVKPPQKSNEANQTGGSGENSPTEKKTKKKKKKSNAQKATAEEATNKSPPKSNQGNTSDSTVKSNSKDNNTATPNSSPKLKISLPKPSKMSTLQKAFLERLTSSRFRELNEELYTHSSDHSFEHFTKNPELFDQYHVGFRKQAKEWPVNPVDVIYKKIVKEYSSTKNKKGNDATNNEKERKQVVVADFGCGDAKLAERLLALQLGKNGQIAQHAAKKKSSVKDTQSACPFKVHSFDLVSGGNALVTPADMTNVPLPKESVDVGVYSLALMGTNVADFVREAWRVLKFNGVLRVAEVRSRFETAAATNEDDRNGGGKRGKLNNGKKNSKKPHHNKKQHNGPDGDEGNMDQPLMLLDEFIALMERCGFECTNMDRSNKMFLFMDFVKVDGSKGLSKKESFSAKPCIYKRR